MRRAITPTTTRIPLTHGDWIDVKDELTYGDRRAIRKATFTGVVADTSAPTGERYQFDASGHAVATCVAYLVDWSIKGLDDKVIAIDTDTRKWNALESAITEDTFDEIQKAIEAHRERQLAKRTAETAPTSAPISA